MTMTRQHFALIAEALKDAHDAYLRADWERERIVVNAVSYRIASALAQTNPNFNRARFLRACGVEE